MFRKKKNIKSKKPSGADIKSKIPKEKIPNGKLIIPPQKQKKKKEPLIPVTDSTFDPIKVKSKETEKIPRNQKDNRPIRSMHKSVKTIKSQELIISKKERKKSPSIDKIFPSKRDDGVAIPVKRKSKPPRMRKDKIIEKTSINGKTLHKHGKSIDNSPLSSPSLRSDKIINTKIKSKKRKRTEKKPPATIKLKVSKEKIPKSKIPKHKIPKEKIPDEERP